MNNKFKKALSLLLSVLIILSAAAAVPFAVSADSGDQEELPFVPVTKGVTKDCEWNYKNGTLTISGSGSTDDYGWTRNNTPKAPWADFNITKIVIENGVTRIGDGAFRFDGPTEITFPDSVTEIGRSVFRDCTTLKTAVIPDSVTELGFAAFCGCSALGSVTLSKELTVIDEAVFFGCEKLSSVEIPDKVTEIVGGAFSCCTALSEVKLPDGLKSIGSMAFEECTSLKSITIPAGVDEIAADAFINCSDELVIHGEAGSKAEAFAKDQNISFEPVVKAILGDADGSGSVDAVDATIVQRHVTKLNVPVPTETLMNGDVDGDGELSITDATFIQRHATSIKTPYPIGTQKSEA